MRRRADEKATEFGIRGALTDHGNLHGATNSTRRAAEAGSSDLAAGVNGPGAIKTDQISGTPLPLNFAGKEKRAIETGKLVSPRTSNDFIQNANRQALLDANRRE